MLTRLQERLKQFEIDMPRLDSAEIIAYWFMVDKEIRKRFNIKLEGGENEK